MCGKQRTLTLMVMAWLSKALLSATVIGRLFSTPSHLGSTRHLEYICTQPALPPTHAANHELGASRHIMRVRTL